MLGLALVGTLCKEQAITVIPVCLAFDLVYQRVSRVPLSTVGIRPEGRVLTKYNFWQTEPSVQEKGEPARPNAETASPATSSAIACCRRAVHTLSQPSSVRLLCGAGLLVYLRLQAMDHSMPQFSR